MAAKQTKKELYIDKSGFSVDLCSPLGELVTADGLERIKNKRDEYGKGKKR